MIQETWYKRHDTRDIIEEKWYKRQEPFFPQLTTKHSYTQHFSNRNVCGRSQRKSVLNKSQNCLWLIKDTFSLWSITYMSVKDYGTFWHCQTGQNDFSNSVLLVAYKHAPTRLIIKNILSPRPTWNLYCKLQFRAGTKTCKGCFPTTTKSNKVFRFFCEIQILYLSNFLCVA